MFWIIVGAILFVFVGIPLIRDFFDFMSDRIGCGWVAFIVFVVFILLLLF